MKISVIIVSFNCRDLLLDCLKSLYNSSFKNFEVIVSDNGSSDGTEEVIKKIFPSVVFWKNGKNLGFGAACNAGAKNSSGDILLFLNPDTQVKRESLQVLSTFFSKNKDVAVVGAKLLWPEGSFQDSYKRFFSPFFSVLELFEFHYYFKNNLLNSKVNYDFELFNEPREVDFVIGAAMAVERNIFFELSGFDEDFFMYFEEIDLCKRIKKRGGKIFFLPYMEVVHKKGKVSENSSVRQIDYYKSMKLYHEKHSFCLSGFFIRISIFLSCIIFIFFISIKLVFTKNKAAKIKKLKQKIELLKWAAFL